MLGLASEPAILLAERLMQIMPKGLAKVFYSDAGATATEVAFKLAAQYWHNIGRPEKNEFVGFAEAYHGDTVGAMSVGRVPAFHRPYFPMLFKVHFAPAPFPYRFFDSEQKLARGDALTSTIRANAAGHEDQEMVRNAVGYSCLRSLEAILRENGGRIAAVCIEPMVQGAAGMIVHPPGFLRGVRELCTRHEVLLIADEVAVGFGRTGRMFACEHEQVTPDLMCVAKGITGGYLPLAATFATQRIFDAFLGDPWEGRTFYHGHTYTGNPLACATALASLDLFEKNRIVENVARNANVLAGMLDDLRELPHVGDIRQLGYMVGIELVEDRATRRPFDSRRRLGAEICMKIRKHGVLLRPLGDVIVLMPPPAMGLEDLKQIVDAVKVEVSAIERR
jgi:adenosylmethionine-8-amino-7-oxononanoate transaminase